jgi:hypothetical protein
LAFDLDAREFKERYADEFRKTCMIIAIAESHNFEKRAQLLRGQHPLSMQVDIATGIANGVLVARSASECADLLYSLLTNRLELEIIEQKEDDCAGYTVLREGISKCPFRVVTNNERLTNSFWNLFLAGKNV